MKTATYKNYTVTRFESERIEATYNGEIANPTKPLLREIAKELNINIENSQGNQHTTRQLGALIIKKIQRRGE